MPVERRGTGDDFPFPCPPAFPLFMSIESSGIPIRSRKNGIKDFGRIFHASNPE
jgi:hypothetical protein